MQLGQGCRKRTPWWCWVQMLLLAAIMLPGAAWVSGQEQPPRPLAAPDPWEQLVQPAPRRATDVPPFREVGPLEIRTYDLSAALKRLQSESGGNRKSAETTLTAVIMAAGGGDWARAGVDIERQEDGELAIQDREPDLDKPEVRWMGQQAIVRHDQQGHQRIAESLKHVAQHGLTEIQLDVQFIEADAELVQDIVGDWQMLAMDVAPVESPRKPRVEDDWTTEDRRDAAGHVRSSTEQQHPVLVQVLGPDARSQLVKKLTDDRRTNILMAPQVVTHNGRSAMIQDGVQRPFVVGLLEDQPQIRVCEEGNKLRVRPRLLDDADDESAYAAQSGVVEDAAEDAAEQRIRLDFEFTHSEILDVVETEFRVAGRDKPVTLQVPEMRVARVESSVIIPLNQTLIVGGLSAQRGKQEDRSLLLTITARRRTPQPSRFMRGTGVISDAGLTGTVIVDSSVIPASATEARQAEMARPAGPRTTRAYHQQRRHLQDVQVALETRVIGLSDRFFESVGVDFDVADTPAPDVQQWRKQLHSTLSDVETFFLLQAAQQDTHVRILQSPKVTVFDGQLVSLNFGDQQTSCPLTMQPVVAEDRRSVRLCYALDQDRDGKPAWADRTPLKIDEGHSLLIQAQDRLKPKALGWSHEVGVPMLQKVPYVSRLFKNSPQHRITQVMLLVTPRVVIEEEEEELRLTDGQRYRPGQYPRSARGGYQYVRRAEPDLLACLPMWGSSHERAR